MEEYNSRDILAELRIQIENSVRDLERFSQRLQLNEANKVKEELDHFLWFYFELIQSSSRWESINQVKRIIRSEIFDLYSLDGKIMIEWIESDIKTKRDALRDAIISTS